MAYLHWDEKGGENVDGRWGVWWRAASRRGSIKRISGLIYEETRGYIRRIYHNEDNSNYILDNVRRRQ